MINGNNGTPVPKHGRTTMKPKPSRALMRSIVKWAACIVTWLFFYSLLINPLGYMYDIVCCIYRGSKTTQLYSVAVLGDEDS